MDDAQIELQFDGIRYGWWQRAEVRASVDDLCASLNLSITAPGTGNNLGITANTVIKVLIGNQLVTTVRLDKLSRSVGRDSHDISIEGRSIARELIDTQLSKTLSGLTLGEIAKRLCDELKVPLKIAAKTKTVEEFAMQCENPSNALINAARTANLLLYPTTDGGLILAEPTKAAPVAALIYGEHILEYEVVDEYSLRFSEYCVKGYNSDEDEAISGRVWDRGIKFYRPMHIMADRHGHGLGSCERRAELERNRRLARAHRIELTVQGWRYRAEEAWRLWEINTQVRVTIPDEGINDVFLIGERAFRIDDRGGHMTRLTVMKRDAYAGSGGGSGSGEDDEGDDDV
ncbi:MAG: phage tail protein [Betaproteobacteria bacterium]|nr:phage tail protein [Betaproteobacteria bacterium]